MDCWRSSERLLTDAVSIPLAGGKCRKIKTITTVISSGKNMLLIKVRAPSAPAPYPVIRHPNDATITSNNHMPADAGSHGGDAFSVGVDGLIQRLDERGCYVIGCFLSRLSAVFPKFGLDVGAHSRSFGTLHGSSTSGWYFSRKST